MQRCILLQLSKLSALIVCSQRFTRLMNPFQSPRNERLSECLEDHVHSQDNNERHLPQYQEASDVASITTVGFNRSII